MTQKETGLPEIRERSISAVYTKIKARLLKVEDVIDKYYDLPSVLLMWINQNRSSLNRVIMIKICWILKEIAKVELTLNSKNREGSDILAQSGGVEFLVKFNKFLKGKNMNEIISMNEDIIQTVVDFKSNELKYQPIKEEMKKDKANQGIFLDSDYF